MRQVDYLIVGAGPTGLGAAYQLKKIGISSFLVLEADEKVGGLSKSYRDDLGFSWDVGGHVLFSKNATFIRLMDELMGENLLRHSRRARVRVAGGWTDYPFQNHFHQLDDDLGRQCRDGLNTAPGPGEATHTFEDWIRHSFGDGIAELFMEPYNRKVWAYPLHLMGFGWVHDRVSSAGENMANATNEGWGLNSFFRYPVKGGIGEIFGKMAQEVSDHVLLGNGVVTVDLERKTVITDRGETFEYRDLLSTAPLNHFVRRVLTPVREDIIAAADQLVHNSLTVVGIGVDATGDRNTSWMYFPEPGYPFYRLTHLHNYAPDITPKDGRQSALMAEIASPSSQHLDSKELVDEVIYGLIKSGLLIGRDKRKIISTWRIDAPYGYPIPTIGRDRALFEIHAFLEHFHVYSRGRFGGWKYEIGNMDHSVMQGIEWADRMVSGAKENIYTTRS